MTAPRPNRDAGREDRSEAFARWAMSSLDAVPDPRLQEPSVDFPSVETILEGLPEVGAPEGAREEPTGGTATQGTATQETTEGAAAEAMTDEGHSDRSEAPANRASDLLRSALDTLVRESRTQPTTPFVLHREFRDLLESLDPEIARSHFESRTGRSLSDLLNGGIEVPEAFRDEFSQQPDGVEAFRSAFADPGSLPAADVVRQTLETSETQAPGWLWSRIRHDFESHRTSERNLESGARRHTRVWVGAAAALLVGTVSAFVLTGGSLRLGGSEDPWAAGPDRTSDTLSNGRSPRFVRTERPLAGFRSMRSIVEEVRDGTPR